MTVNALALATLSGQTAILGNTAFGGIQSSFLMKRVRYFMAIASKTIDDDGPILVGIANGDASVAEISAAMIEGNTQGPTDVTETLTQDETWVVYQNTVRALKIDGAGTEGWLDSGWINFGGKNGIPALEGAGFELFFFNAGSGALSTGSSVNGICHVQGVWLRG